MLSRRGGRLGVGGEPADTGLEPVRRADRGEAAGIIIIFFQGYSRVMRDPAHGSWIRSFLRKKTRRSSLGLGQGVLKTRVGSDRVWSARFGVGLP